MNRRESISTRYIWGAKPRENHETLNWSYVYPVSLRESLGIRLAKAVLIPVSVGVIVALGVLSLVLGCL